jgi:hypothetical protein
MIKGDKELMHKYRHQIVPAIPLTWLVQLGTTGLQWSDQENS